MVKAAPDARIGPGTVFCFDLDGNAMAARYGGGGVAQGWLAGVFDPLTFRAEFRYLQVGDDGGVDSGESTAEITRSPDGRWRLVEHFSWSSRPGIGTNELEELLL